METTKEQFDSMSLNDLLALYEFMGQAVARRRDTFVSEVRAQAAKLGVDPDAFGRKTRTKQSVAPKYRTPDGALWSGRGKPPKPFKVLIDQGATKADFLIKE